MKAPAVTFLLCLFGALPVSATVVSWNANLDHAGGSTHSASHAFASPEPPIRMTDTTTGWSPATPLGLYYRNPGFDQAQLGLGGLVNRQGAGNEYFPTQYQVDVDSVLPQAFADETLRLGNVQRSPMTAFAAWDTSVRGKAGLPADEYDGSSSAPVFRSVANFTNDGFVSIGVLSGPNMPDAFPANLTCVPEMSALFPLVGLIAAVALTQILRRRRVAQFRAPSSTGKI